MYSIHTCVIKCCKQTKTLLSFVALLQGLVKSRPNGRHLRLYCKTVGKIPLPIINYIIMYNNYYIIIYNDYYIIMYNKHLEKSVGTSWQYCELLLVLDELICQCKYVVLKYIN